MGDREARGALSPQGGGPRSEDFLREKLLTREGEDLDRARTLLSSLGPDDLLAEKARAAGLVDDDELFVLLEAYADEARAGGAAAEAHNLDFGKTVVREGHVTVLQVWSGLKEREKVRAQGKERTLDFFLAGDGPLDTGLTLGLLKKQGKDLLVCRDCGRREIVTGEEVTGDFTCPECSGVLLPAAKVSTPTLEKARKDKLEGQVVAGCLLEKKLGQGGMGAVYKARHLALNKPVAIKFLSEHIANEHTMKRFLKEARAAARLDHPNIVTVHDTGVDDDKHFIIMQFVEGESVADRVKRDGPLPLLEALDIAVAAGQGIAAAHAAGMIHRDIKPDNLMLDRSGAVKVADFGLAKDLSDASGLTLSQQAMGTPNYMSPEQANDAKSVDARSDVYAFGATLYAMLAGTPPFTGSTPWAIISRHQSEPVPDLRAKNPDVPGKLWLDIQTMMAKSPGDRFADMGAVVEALKARKREISLAHAEDSAPTLAPRPAPPPPAAAAPPSGLDAKTPVTFLPPAEKKSSLPAVVGVVAVVGIVALVVVVLALSGVFDPKETPGPPSPTPGPTGPDAALVEAAAQAYLVLDREARALLAERKFEAALDLLLGFDPRFRGTRSWDEAERSKIEILRAAVAHFREALAAEPAAASAEEAGASRERARAIALFLEEARAGVPASPVEEDLEALRRDADGKAASMKALQDEILRLEALADVSGLEIEALDARIATLEAYDANAVPGAEPAALQALETLKAARVFLAARLEEEKREAARDLFGRARPEILRLLAGAEFEAALRLLEPFEACPAEDVATESRALRAKAQEDWDAARAHLAPLGAAEELLGSGSWTDLVQAEELVRGVLEARPHAAVLAKARAAETRIAGERARRIAAWREEGFGLVEGGTARLGSDDPADRNPAHEAPLATVLLGHREVTNGEYAAFVSETGHAAPLHWSGGAVPEGLANHPVTQVSYADASAYCAWLSGKTKARVRLPTADEWEAAAALVPGAREGEGERGRGGDARRYPWGDAFEEGKANLSGGATAAAGAHPKDASPCGCLDMAGNVAEWTWTLGNDPEAPDAVVCGGCCDDGGLEATARCAYRQILPARTRGRSLGFRIAREIE